VSRRSLYAACAGTPVIFSVPLFIVHEPAVIRFDAHRTAADMSPVGRVRVFTVAPVLHFVPSEKEAPMASPSCLTEMERQPWSSIPEIAFCKEKNRLQREFLETIRVLSALQEKQIRCVIEGDGDFTRYDEMLHEAQRQKDRAKYAWIAHVEEHRCHE
jgi:hypothetical protein